MVHGADDDDNSKQQVSEDPQDSAGELIELALQFLGHPIDLGHLIDLGQASSKLQKSVDTLLSKLDSLGRIPSLSRESYERICQQDIRGDNVLLAAVLCELAVDCQPITLRGLFYRAVSAGMFPSTDKEYYNRVGRLVTQLRRRGLAWTHEQTCMACHTTGVYMAERTQLTTWFGPPREEIRAAFVADVPSAESLKVGLPNRPHGFPVWRSLGLAQWDRHVTGKLSHATDVSLREMLLRLPEEGLYKTVDKVEIPYTTTGFELSVQAALCTGCRPGLGRRTGSPRSSDPADTSQKGSCCAPAA